MPVRSALLSMFADSDLCLWWQDPADGRVKRWTERLSPWSEMRRTFKSDGFYERFPAKGQLERVSRIQKDLAKAIKD